MQELDLNNVEGIELDDYSNVVDPSAISAGASAVTNLVTGVIGARRPKTSEDTMIKGECGKKPLFNFGGQKDQYFKCAGQVTKRNMEANKPQPPIILPPPTVPVEDTFLGMPKAAGIGVTIFGVTLLLAGGYMMVKTMKGSPPVPASVPTIV